MPTKSQLFAHARIMGIIIALLLGALVGIAYKWYTTCGASDVTCRPLTPYERASIECKESCAKYDGSPWDTEYYSERDGMIFVRPRGKQVYDERTGGFVEFNCSCHVEPLPSPTPTSHLVIAPTHTPRPTCTAPTPKPSPYVKSPYVKRCKLVAAGSTGVIEDGCDLTQGIRFE